MKNHEAVIEFSERLKRHRGKARLTQHALAFAADINVRTLQRIEAGEQAVTIDLFFSLCRGLGIQPDEFFKGFKIELEQ